MQNSRQTRPARVSESNLARKQRADDGNAFLPDPSGANRHRLTADSDSESIAEEFIASATTGEPIEMDAQDESVEEEWGGPLLEFEVASAVTNVEEDPAGRGSDERHQKQGQKEGASRNIFASRSLRKVPSRLH